MEHMARILVTHDLSELARRPLYDAGHVVEVWTSSEPAELCRAAPHFDGIVAVLTDRVDAELIEAGAAGRLRVVANVAVGYDNIDVAAARRHHVAVCNTPGVLDESTADIALLLILAASRRSSFAERDLRAGNFVGWSIDGYLGRDVHGATLGLVGYGRIGRAVARRAAAFDMTVRHHARHDTGAPGYVASLDELLAMSDVVSLHVPLSAATRGMIGASQLARMRSTAVLVNTSRGPVLDEMALAAALGAGRLFAAGLDVYDGEPEINPVLLAAPHTVLLPHIASATIGTRTRMSQLACQGACDVVAGRVPPNLVAAGPGD
jgi:glyoxylate reductase